MGGGGLRTRSFILFTFGVGGGTGACWTFLSFSAGGALALTYELIES